MKKILILFMIMISFSSCEIILDYYDIGYNDGYNYYMFDADYASSNNYRHGYNDGLMQANRELTVSYGYNDNISIIGFNRNYYNDNKLRYYYALGIRDGASNNRTNSTYFENPNYIDAYIDGYKLGLHLFNKKYLGNVNK